MRVHDLQHVAFEGLGSLEHWLSTRQAQLSASYLFEPHTQLPSCETFDELQPAPFIQTAAQIQAAPAERYQAVNQLME